MRALTVGLSRVLAGAVACVTLVTGCKSHRSEDQQATTGQRAREPAPPDDSPGALASESCTYAMAVLDRLDVYRGVEWPLEPSKIREILTRTKGEANLLDWLADSDRALGRVSEGEPTDLMWANELLAHLAERDQASLRADLTRIVTRLRAVTLLEMRRLLAEVADERATGPEALARWDEAHCLWSGGLRKLATRADALPARGGEGWEASIAEAFANGRAALDDPAKASAEVKAAKQQIEKGMYAVFYRLILAEAESRTALGAAEARELVDALEDRLADRNGPGLARIRAQLDAAPADIDATQIERELAVAFTKRARKYCDKAVSSAELATPDAIAETWEGVIYTQVILPSMREALSPEGFDADAYSADWQGYLEAVTAGDAQTAAEISARLIEWNCAYQDRLGLSECSSSTNEIE
ncbi:hypothetical protein ENSA5_27620 [Enhygromyxa salina]|uniref:Uncharacterized protein n=1 Tax=Enhygromyxa salina TaxID=215803 RepID=A0A2S9Y7J9_9BACT|nr:hypothetical protein [Enhygromyxa salina]PRQ01080.1 hypothetical protein ENSA5_27620 [Enhygromyxa salina]